MKFQTINKHRVWWLTLFTVATASIISTVILYSFLPVRKNGQILSSNSLEVPTTVNAVAAEGYLEPQGEVVHLFASASAQTPNPRVEKLLVKLGDRVKAGQIIAILDSHYRLEAALRKAQKQAIISQVKLTKVTADTHHGEMNALKANIESIKAERRGKIAVQKVILERLEADLQGKKQAQKEIIEGLKAELDNAQKEYERYQQLYKTGVIATRELDSKYLTQKTTQQRLLEAKITLDQIVTSYKSQITENKENLKRIGETFQQQEAEAKAKLEQITEVSPINVAIAKAELESTQAAVQQAQAELNLAYVRSPFSGQILKIHAQPGEIVTAKGIVAIGRTQQMYVTAEIYETDISRIRIGQRATITSGGLKEKLHGTVDEIGLEIGKRDVLSTDPVADVDARVVEVKIRLDSTDSKKVAALTNLRVKLVIDTFSISRK